VPRWLDRLERWCGPVPAWGIAVILVAVLLPPAVLYRCLSKR
jgi:hypothetical protein